MAEIGIFYGSTSGYTGKVAQMIAEALGQERCEVVNMEDFGDFDEMLEFDKLLIGSATWGQGEIQNDWRDPMMELEEYDFSGKTVAFFGTGDHKTHGEHFCSALKLLYDAFKAQGASCVGAISTDGYTYEESLAAQDGTFLGLAVDEVNEADKTPERLTRWLESIKPYFV